VCWDDKDIINGRPTGAVRVSVGYMTSWDDLEVSKDAILFNALPSLFSVLNDIFIIFLFFFFLFFFFFCFFPSLLQCFLKFVRSCFVDKVATTSLPSDTQSSAGKESQCQVVMNTKKEFELRERKRN
jgi:hypothetical protein